MIRDPVLHTQVWMWRMHHRSDGVPKKQYRVRKARGIAQKFPGSTAYACWCGAWHIASGK